MGHQLVKKQGDLLAQRGNACVVVRLVPANGFQLLQNLLVLGQLISIGRISRIVDSYVVNNLEGLLQLLVVEGAYVVKGIKAGFQKPV